jgi:hypothetical protein
MHRLVTSLAQVDNGEAPMGETDSRIDPHPGIVWPTVGNARRHRSQDGLLRCAAKLSRYPAHGMRPLIAAKLKTPVLDVAA